MPLRAYHTTVRGSTHCSQDHVCEDASGCKLLSGGNACIVAVADGLGDKACTRSAVGAQLAVDVVLSRLAEAAETGIESLSGKQLVRDILQAWGEAVLEHAATHSLEERERALVGEICDRWVIRQLYATTLVAALMTPEYCVLVQQGDGCCLVMDTSGEYHLPVPRDERCVKGKTSSLADFDAAGAMRSVRLGASATPYAAVYVMTDGLSRGFASTEGMNDFFDWLLDGLAMQEEMDVQPWLQKQIHDAGTVRSRDDVSLGVALTVPIPERIIEVSRCRREAYGMRSELDEIRLRLVSMERKHQYLRQQAERQGEGAAEEYLAYHDTYVRLASRAEELERLLGVSESSATRFQSMPQQDVHGFGASPAKLRVSGKVPHASASRRQVAKEQSSFATRSDAPNINDAACYTRLPMLASQTSCASPMPAVAESPWLSLRMMRQMDAMCGLLILIAVLLLVMICTA